MMYANGMKYTGKYMDGKRHGQGVLMYADGGTYTGKWKNGMWYGEGFDVRLRQ